MKLIGDFKALIWERVESEKGLEASINFKVERPQCDRCKNENKRVVVSFEKKDEYSRTKALKLCVDCFTDLIQQINKALDEFRLVRLVLAGVSVGEALGEITKNVADKSELQASLDKLVASLYHETGEIEQWKKKQAQAVEETFKDLMLENQDEEKSTKA